MEEWQSSLAVETVVTLTASRRKNSRDNADFQGSPFPMLPNVRTA